MNKQFYKLPKQLFTDPRYSELSAISKLLYTMLADRKEISKTNNWFDSNGKVYIYFTRAEAQELLGVGRRVIMRAFAELTEAGLISQKRTGLCKANVIYVHTPSHDETSEKSKEELPEVPKCTSSNTENNNTENNNTLSSDKEAEESFIEDICKKCELDIFNKGTQVTFKSIFTALYRREYIYVGKNFFDRSMIRERLSQLTADALIYIMNNMGEVSDIKNPIAYLTASVLTAAERYGAQCIIDESSARHDAIKGFC